MKIRPKLIILFSIMSVIPMLLFSLIAINYNKNDLQNEINAHLMTTAHDRADYAEELLKDRMAFSDIIASRTVLRERFAAYISNPSSEKQAVLNSMLNDSASSIKDITGIILIAPNGTSIASTEISNIGNDYSKDDFFVNGKRTSGIYFNTDKNGNILLLASSPVTFNNSFVGVSLLSIGLESLNKIVSDRSGFGETTEVVVATKINGQLTYIFQRRYEAEAISDTGEIVLPIKMAVSGGDEVLITNSSDYRGVPVIAALQYIPNGKIGMVVKVDQAEALKPIRTMEQISAITITILVLFILVISFFVSGIFTKPIIQLTRTIDEISTGRLETQIDSSLSKSNDEIGDLTRSLQRVLVSLKLAILRTGLSKEQMGLGEGKQKKR